jgi:predicted RNA-binding Zn-ribbon protein involved in translation (DUF1610 family)
VDKEILQTKRESIGGSMTESYPMQHRRCPQCGGLDITHTWSGEKAKRGEPYRDNDGATCNSCGWDGIVHYLVPVDTISGRGIVHDLVPAPAETSEEPLTITSLFFALKRRESILSEERTRARLAKYRLLVKEYIRLVQNCLSSLDLATLQTALTIATQIKETGDKTPTDDEIEKLILLCGLRPLCGTNHDIPPQFWVLHNALHGKPEEA